MCITSKLIEVTCNQFTCGLMEIDEWLGKLSTTLNDEISNFVMDLHFGHWTWDHERDDWVIQSLGR